MIRPRPISLVTPGGLSLTAGVLLLAVAAAFFFILRSGASYDGNEAAIALRVTEAERGLDASEALHEIEESALAYLLTGRSEHRERYMSARGRWKQAARDLAAAMPIPTRTYAPRSLEERVARRLADLDAAIEARRRGNGFDPATFVDDAREEHAWRLYIQYRREAMPAMSARMADHLDERRDAERRASLVILLLSAIAALGAASLILAAAQRMVHLRDFAAESARANADLAEARARAEEATRAKTQLLAAVSHDIRQPLSAVSIYLDILGRRIEDKSVAPILERVSAAMASMARMSKQLLDISRYDGGGYQAKREALDLDGIFDSVAGDVGAQAWAAGVRLRVVRTSLEPIGDSGLVESIVRNLVWNGITYAAGGHVLLGARRRGDFIEIEVRDDGPGLPEAQRRLFDDNAPPAGPIAPANGGGKGLGLGLALVRRCADLLGARITIAPTARGTCFRLRLPRSA